MLVNASLIQVATDERFRLVTARRTLEVQAYWHGNMLMILPVALCEDFIQQLYHLRLVASVVSIKGQEVYIQ